MFNAIKDFDLIVTDIDKWNEVSLLIPLEARPNTYRGWKFERNGLTIDIWPETLQHYLRYGRMDYHGVVYAIDFVNKTIYKSEKIY